MPPKCTGKLLSGKIVVFTGTLSMPRKEATMMAERSGATVVSSVTNACNVIVAGPGAGSKLNTAASKGIEVWTEAEFHRKMSVEEMDERLSTNKGRVIADTGDSKFQFSLSWDAFVDLDIQLDTPKGLCWYQSRKVAGADLDVDRMPEYGSKSWAIPPVENIVCDKAFPGVYTCRVIFYSNWASPKSKNVPFIVRSRVGAHDSVIQANLAKRDDEIVICTFVVGNDGRIASYTELPAPTKKKAVAKPKAATPKTARKAPVKAPKKVAAKKPAAKKVAAKKPATKKVAAKKPATKKVTAKKPAAKKVTAKKPAAKKPAAKKAAAKRK